MRKTILLLLIFASVFVLAAAVDLIDDAYLSLKEFLDQPDSGAFVGLLERAKGLLIVPKYYKVGWIFGGQYGTGILLRKDLETGNWYGPLFVKIHGLSLGPQIGFQSISLIAVVMDRVDSFLETNVTLGGSLSVAAGPLGRRLGADFNFEAASIYSYSIARGFYAGFSLEGARVSVDKDLNKEYHGSDLTPYTILYERLVRGRAEKIVDLLRKTLGK